MSNTLKVNKKDFELNPTFEKMAVMKWGHCGVLDFLTNRRSTVYWLRQEY